MNKVILADSDRYVVFVVAPKTPAEVYGHVSFTRDVNIDVSNLLTIHMYGGDTCCNRFKKGDLLADVDATAFAISFQLFDNSPHVVTAEILVLKGKLNILCHESLAINLAALFQLKHIS
jgi:hypothetical protein